MNFTFYFRIYKKSHSKWNSLFKQTFLNVASVSKLNNKRVKLKGENVLPPIARSLFSSTGLPPGVHNLCSCVFFLYVVMQIASHNFRLTRAMNSLIQVVNRLQDVFRSIDTNIVQLPQIAVVGTQVRFLCRSTYIKHEGHHK